MSHGLPSLLLCLYTRSRTLSQIRRQSYILPNMHAYAYDCISTCSQIWKDEQHIQSFIMPVWIRYAVAVTMLFGNPCSVEQFKSVRTDWENRAHGFGIKGNGLQNREFRLQGHFRGGTAFLSSCMQSWSSSNTEYELISLSMKFPDPQCEKKLLLNYSQ